MSIAIDFTGSNGRPTQPDSLHYINPNAPNQYQMAINAITSILLNYDTDKKIPAFGFGGIPKMVGKVSHCFPLSGNMGNTEALGVQQLMSMYNQALLNVELSGPTYFAPILTEIMKISAMCRDQGSNTYQIFLIITDG